MIQIDYNRAAKYVLPMSLAWVILVSFLAKFEVLGGFWARWAVEG